jgi:endonuclease/exonuclease/phosphatase family metal-dependent hydrolase
VKRLAFLGIAALFAAACQSDRLVNPNDAPSGAALQAGRVGARSQLPAPGGPGVRIMTYNVYLGTDLGPLMAAQSQAEYFMAAFGAYTELQQTDFSSRAEKIADQIATAQPDAVGLQEVALWSVSEPYDPTQPPLAPFAVKYDFLQLVLDALQARGLTYVPASVVWTSDVMAPAPTEFDAEFNPTAFALVRFQDRDAILVRKGVNFREARSAKYKAYLPLDLLGTQTGLYRGWCSVKLTVQGKTFTLVNSHLEAENADVNYLQALELLGTLNPGHEPVVWVGDFNSDANSEAPSYAAAIGAGFVDLWPLAHPSDPGLTNGPNDGVGALDASFALVPYPTLVFDKRIDLVLLKDWFGAPHDVYAEILGNQPGDRTATGLYPSDHAAVAAVFDFPTNMAGGR